MDPISATRLAALPQMQGAALPQVSNIPVVELEKLSPSSPVQTQPAGEGQFSNILGHLIEQVSEKQNVASDSVNALLSGKNVSLHQTVIAMEEANVAFQLMVEVRNKLLEAYQEIMRMQV